MQMANDRSDTMRARRLVGRPLVSVWLAALVMGCSANLPPMPTATAEGTATVAEATPAEATPAGGTQGPTTPAPSSFPSTSASPIPSQAASEWVVRDVPEYTTTGGADLTRTVDGSTGYVHVVVSNLEEAWEGFNDASVYLRTEDDGRTWSKRLLVGGMFPQLASSGRHVYLAYEAYACGGGIGVLRNDQHGLRRAWAPVSCVTPSGSVGSEGSPAIAASGKLVYVAASNDTNGRIVAHVSRDRGRTWSHVRLGSAHETDGFPGGLVKVAATRDLAAVAWTDRDRTLVRVSTDAGRHWGRTTLLAAGGVTAGSGAGPRLAFTGATRDGLPWLRVRRDDGTWERVALPGGRLGAGSVALGDAASITYAACGFELPDGSIGPSTWVTSSDGETGVSRGSLPQCDATDPMLLAVDGQSYLVAGATGEDDYTYGLAASP